MSAFRKSAPANALAVDISRRGRMNVRPLLTQNELSRKLQITQSRISRLLRNSGIQPDFSAGHALLFRPARVEAIGRKLNVGSR